MIQDVFSLFGFKKDCNKDSDKFYVSVDIPDSPVFLA